MKQKKRVSKSEFADLLGLSRARISQLINLGLPTVGAGRHQLIPVLPALNWYRYNIHDWSFLGSGRRLFVEREYARRGGQPCPANNN
jgi:hypothetical protein